MRVIITGNDFLNRTPIAQEIIARIDKKKLHQIQKFLHSKGNKTGYRMGESLCQLF
jgi:hypothetical protein